MADAPTGAEIKYDLLDTRAAPPLSAGPGEPAVIEADEPAAAAESKPAADAPAAGIEPAAEPGETDAEAVAEQGETEEAAAEPEPKPAGRARQRVETLAEARRAAEAREAAATARETAAIEREARMATRLEEALARAAPPAPATVPPEPPEARPARELFDTPEAYDEALIGWASRDAKRTLQSEQSEEAQRARTEKEATDRAAADATTAANFETMRTSHLSRRDAFIAETPDYAEVAERNDGTLQISMPMGIAIMQNEDGPKAAYYLGKHPDVAAKIAAMVIPGQVFPPGNPMAGQPVPDVQRQLIEMGKVFASVSSAPARPAPRPLPAPITPLRGGNGAAVARTLAEIGEEGSMEEYAAERMPVLRQARNPFAKPN